MAASLVVVGLELRKLAFQVPGIPEQHLVEKFSAHGSDQALDEWVRQRHVGDGFDSSISRIRRFVVHRYASNTGS